MPISCLWSNNSVNVGCFSAWLPFMCVCFSPRLESLELALQVALPVEESLLLCDLDLALREVAVQEFHLMDADSVYQNLRVNNASRCIDRVIRELQIVRHF